MLTTKKTFQTKFLSTLLIFALVSTIVLNKQANEKLWSDADDSEEWKLACEMLQSILQRVDHLNGCVDYSVIEIIAEESNAYFQADASVQDVASRIDQRVTLYLMEQE